MLLITAVIASRRMRIAGHCLRHNDESNIMGTKVWQEKSRKKKVFLHRQSKRRHRSKGYL